MFVYRNLKTGAEVRSVSEVHADGWVKVEEPKTEKPASEVEPKPQPARRRKK